MQHSKPLHASTTAYSDSGNFISNLICDSQHMIQACGPVRMPRYTQPLYRRQVPIQIFENLSNYKVMHLPSTYTRIQQDQIMCSAYIPHHISLAIHSIAQRNPSQFCLLIAEPAQQIISEIAVIYCNENKCNRYGITTIKFAHTNTQNNAHHYDTLIFSGRKFPSSRRAIKMPQIPQKPGSSIKKSQIFPVYTDFCKLNPAFLVV